VHCTERSLARNAAADMTRHHRRHRRRQAGSTGSYRPMVEVRRDRGSRGGSPGKLGILTRGAQSERPRDRRQSGVVDIEGRLRREVH
jgi:hypothetical protein